jgi:hypothetical protein
LLLTLLFFDSCSSQTVKGANYGQSGNIRVCNHCAQLVKMEAAFAAQLAAAAQAQAQAQAAYV